MSKALSRGPEVVIRRANPGDASLLAELASKTFSETFHESCRPEDLEVYLKTAYGTSQQAAELADQRIRFLIAEVEGTACGFAQTHEGETPDCITGPKPIEIARIYVLKHIIGRGVGRSLMDAMLKEIESSGYETVWLGVWEGNHRAQAFYRRWGFRAVGSHIFHVGSDAQNDLLMELCLPRK